jgi:hypothetical protein
VAGPTQFRLAVTPSAIVKAALPDVLAGAERASRVAADDRASLSTILAGSDIRQIADRDPEVNAHLADIVAGLAARDDAATLWRNALAAATTQWDASLAELARLHPEPDVG